MYTYKVTLTSKENQEIIFSKEFQGKIHYRQIFLNNMYDPDLGNCYFTQIFNGQFVENEENSLQDMAMFLNEYKNQMDLFDCNIYIIDINQSPILIKKFTTEYFVKFMITTNELDSDAILGYTLEIGEKK